MQRLFFILTILVGLLLTAKAEETPPACEGILNVLDPLLTQNDTVFTCVGTSITFEDGSLLEGLLTDRDWNFGDGNVQLDALLSAEASHTYTQEGVFTVSLTVDDGVMGCPIITTEQTVVVLGNPEYSIEIDSIDCHGNCNGALTLDLISDNDEHYSVVWDALGTPSATISGLCTGNYSVLVTDGLGCTDLPSSMVNLPDPFQLIANIDVGDTISLCPDNGVTDITLGLAGGTGSYLVDWGVSTAINQISESLIQFDPTVNSLDQTYYVLVEDENGCLAEDSIHIRSTPGLLQGTVSIGANPCIDCEVYQYRYTQVASAWERVNLDTTDVNGNYNFGLISNLLPFTIMANPDTVNYHNVAAGFYSGNPNAHTWAVADVLDNVCGMDLTKDISLVEPMTFNGTNTLGGTVWYSYTGKMQAEDPIPLIDVVVEKTPPGQASGRQITGNDGTYEFDFVPNSDTTYTLYVSIPGIPVVNTYEILANVGNETYCDLDFCLNEDSTEINICNGNESPCLVTTEPNVGVNESFVLYPNPNNGIFAIETGKFAETESEIRIIDPSGRLVFQKQYPQTPYVINMVNVAEGYYMVQIMNQKHSDASPISVMRY